MSKVFGYSKDSGKDWFLTSAYGDKEIESIKDPDGGNSIKLPTAIPSPFARIDLVKNAFRNICKNPALKFFEKGGEVIVSKEDESLVSYCLDLAEMLFNLDALKDDVRIIKWHKEGSIQQLKYGSPAHQRLADTLLLYLDQDKTTYNFDLLSTFYLIEYKHQIIGGTSPVTLFFTTANDLTLAQIKLAHNNTLFGDKFTPLYERDPDFQKYLHLLFKAHPVLKERLRHFNDYLEKNLIRLGTTNPVLYDEIKKLSPTTFKTNYDELNTGTENDHIEVLGAGLRKRKQSDISEFIGTKSEFRIASSKYKGNKPPLVLQNAFPKALLYAKDTWSNFPVPYVDRSPLDKRRLPGINTLYPYLTISDFLEPHLVRLVYPINKDRFYDGNLTIVAGNDLHGYLLPLKPLFFDYFRSDDLVNQGPGKPSFTMVQGASNSVKVTLRIPIQKEGEYISFERLYFQAPAQEDRFAYDEEKNKGIIVPQEVGVTLFPFIKGRDQDFAPYYRVQLIDRNVVGALKNTEYNLKFFSNDTTDEIKITARKIRSIKRADAVDTATSQYYILQNNFDYIQLCNPLASGMIIPQWAIYQPGNEAFSFAIDFGTTNTHIEYKIGSESPRPFDITESDTQIATLFHPTKTTADFSASGAIALRELIHYEFLPHYIGGKSPYRFPHRTVLAESHALNIETQTFTLADFNIPFSYGTIAEKDKINSNMKWAKREPGNQTRVRAFFEKIIMMMRAKVLNNRGNLSATRLVWFYPSSMKPARKSSLEGILNELFEQYFNTTNRPVAVTESLAPFFYFKGANRLPGGSYKPVVSVDIGGGTTDIVVIQANKPLLLTSFKFAANSIFGDGFSEYGAANSNGLIQKYMNHYEKLLSTNNLFDLLKVLKTVKDKNRTEDISTFFFTIEGNPGIQDKKMFSYNSLLANDDDMKIIFLYFYVAIIYHIAEIMKKKGIALPKHLIFSGTGSKILSIITSDMSLLTNLSTKVFEHVYQESFGDDQLSIETEKDIPKEVTCKGGLMSNAEDLNINIQDIRSILTCLEDQGIDSLSLSNLSDTHKNDIASYVKNFNAIFLDLHNRLDFADYFNVSPKSMEIFKNNLNKNLRDYLEEGLEYNRKMDDVALKDDKELEETLFFYPLIGGISNLTGHLSSISRVNN